MNENTIAGTCFNPGPMHTADFGPNWRTDPIHGMCPKCGAPVFASKDGKAAYTCTCKEEGLL